MLTHYLPVNAIFGAAEHSLALQYVSFLTYLRAVCVVPGCEKSMQAGYCSSLIIEFKIM